MKILITGGSGFIGTHLIRELARLGHECWIYDLRSPKPGTPATAHIQGDIRNPDQIRNTLEIGFDHIFHFAAIVSVPECEGDPEGSRKTNVEGTRNVAEAVLSSSQPGTPIIFASSAAVYGDPSTNGEPLHENLHPLRPVSHYGRQKLESEILIRDLVVRRGLKALSFRFFNVFGEGQDPTSPYSGVITRFREAIRYRREAMLFNQGKNTRDFISVSDIARACVLSLELHDEHLEGQPVNLCSGRRTSVSELYSAMCAQANEIPMPRLLPPREGDIEHSCGNPGRAMELLRFEASSTRDWWA